MVAKKVKRVVVKVGTSTLVQQNGQVNLPVIDNLAFTLSALNKRGLEVILVSSGAMGVGLESLGLTKRPSDIAEQQALSSVGQLELMRIYSQRFLNYQTTVSQLLLTRDVLHYPVSRQHVLNTIEVLMKKRIIPIILSRLLMKMIRFRLTSWTTTPPLVIMMNCQHWWQPGSTPTC